MLAATPTAVPRQFVAPEKVQWAAQFLDEQLKLVTCGAYHENEGPAAFAPCALCGGGGGGGGGAAAGNKALASLAAHTQQQGHRERRRLAREEYACVWQELVAPDGRPYFYEHISHTWSFAQPAQLMVPLSSLDAARDMNSTEEALRWRLARALESVLQRGVSYVQPWTPASAGVVATMPTGSVALDAEKDVAEATDSEGQKYWFNPRTRTSNYSREELLRSNKEFYSKVTSVQASRGQEGLDGQAYYWTCQDAGGTQHSAWTLEDLWNQAFGQKLSVEEDVEEIEQEGGEPSYWVNPRTGARAWYKEELIKMNQDFYKSVTRTHGASGQAWWVWVGSSGQEHAAWSLEELWKAVSPDEVPEMGA